MKVSELRANSCYSGVKRLRRTRRGVEKAIDNAPSLAEERPAGDMWGRVESEGKCGVSECVGNGDLEILMSGVVRCLRMETEGAGKVGWKEHKSN